MYSEKIQEKLKENPNVRLKYPPNESCKFCSGTGLKKSGSFCICLFVNHSYSDSIGRELCNFAKKKLKELKSL
jgi:hypothetical protein